MADVNKLFDNIEKSIAIKQGILDLKKQNASVLKDKGTTEDKIKTLKNQNFKSPY